MRGETSLQNCGLEINSRLCSITQSLDIKWFLGGCSNVSDQVFCLKEMTATRKKVAMMEKAGSFTFADFI